jgi:hypothetical protein
MQNRNGAGGAPRRAAFYDRAAESATIVRRDLISASRRLRQADRSSRSKIARPMADKNTVTGCSHHEGIKISPGNGNAHRDPHHSHSMVPDRGDALIFRDEFSCTRRKIFTIRQKFRAPDCKRGFRQSAICSVSATIGIYRSIFRCSRRGKWAIPCFRNTAATGH